MKIEHITTGGGRDLYRITDSTGATVTMTPEDALIVLQFLYENVDDIMRLVSTPDREPFLQECPYCGGHHESALIERCPLNIEVQPPRPTWAQWDEE